MDNPNFKDDRSQKPCPVNAHLSLLMDAAQIAYVVTDQNLRVCAWNQGAQERFGYTAREALGLFVDQVIPLDQRTLDHWQTIRTVWIEIDGLCRKEANPCALHLAPTPSQDHAQPGMAILAVDAPKAEPGALIEKAAPLDPVSLFAPVGIFHADMEGRILMANSELAWMLGYESASQVLRHVPDFQTQVMASPGQAEKFMFRLREAEQVARLRCRIKRKDKSLLWTLSFARLVHGPDGRPTGFNGYLLDISETVRAEKALRKANRALEAMAVQDGLTGIANRRKFDDYLDTEWRRLIREQKPITLILCDIDHFKGYNDRYGHQTGDLCLKDVATVLKACARRPGDLAARYGGEEFAMVLPATDGAGGLTVAARILRAVENLGIPHGSSSVSPVVTVSIGIACQVPGQDETPEGLIRKADAALYAAKENGRNQAKTAWV